MTIEEVRSVTYLTQIERGVPTGDLNPVRSNLDMMKGGRISRYIHPARMVHLMSIEPRTYEHLMYHDSFIHTVADYSTYELAIHNLKRWDAWDVMPASVRRHLERADPEHATVKAEEFEEMNSRVFGLMPGRALPAAMKKAEELGFSPVLLAEQLKDVEASQAALVMASIARTVESRGEPFEPPCALFADGELVVIVGEEGGVGGRHQEFALTAAQRISGSENIVIGSVDTDGTDGPGVQFVEELGGAPCLAGGITDGTTVGEAQKVGVNIVEELKRHNTTPPLWKLNSGIVATPNIRVGDIIVALIMGRDN